MLSAITRGSRRVPFAAIGTGLFILGFAVLYYWNLPFIALIILAAFSLVFENRRAPAARPVGLFWVLFFAGSVGLSAGVSIDLVRSLKLSVPLLPAGLVFFLIAGQFRSMRHLRMVLVVFSVLLLVVSVQLIIEVLAHPGGRPATWIAALNNPIFVVPNDLALLAVLSPVSLVFFRCEQNIYVRTIAVLGIVFSVLAISLYQSRTGFLTMLISMGVCAWFLRPRLAVIGTALLVSLGLIGDALLGYPLLTKFQSIADQRFSLWLAAWKMFLDAPLLGHGPHTYGLLVQFYVHDLEMPDWGPLKDLAPPWDMSMYSPWAHNLYMETLATQGLIGLVALVGLLAGALRLGWKMRGSANEQTRFYAIAVTSGLLGFCIAGVYELSFLRIWVTVVLFTYVAILACLHRFAWNDNGGDV